MVGVVVAKAPMTAQVRGRAELLGAASTAPEAVAAVAVEVFAAARAEYEQQGWVSRARAGDVGSTAERVAAGWDRAMARLLKGRWGSFAGFVRAVENRRRRWGHWWVWYQQTLERLVAVEEVEDGSFVG